MSGKFIKHMPCTGANCSSSDGMAVYEQEDGKIDGFCYVCQHYDKNPLGSNVVEQDEVVVSGEAVNDIVQYESRELTDRHLRVDTVNHYGVKVALSSVSGEVTDHFYPVFKKGELSGFKKRHVEGKKFYSVGDVKNPEFFGQHLYNQGGKMIMVTEGECDAMAAYQMFKDKGKNYKVVSVPHGSSSAVQTFRENIEWVEKFETVVIAFDQDGAGKKAAKEVSELLTPGKARIMSFSEKDPNDMLKKNLHNEFFESLRNSRVERPDGIVSGGDTWDKLKEKPQVESLPYPEDWEELNKKTYGLRIGDLDTWTSGLFNSPCIA